MAMKPSLGVAVSVLLSVATVGLADECNNICADVRKGMSFKSACNAFRNSLPRPKISRKCQAGFNAAVELNCYDACINGGYLQPYVYERRLDEACNGALKETPRVLCHDACIEGYRSGAKDMSTALTERMAEAAPTALAALKEDTTGRRQTARNARIPATTLGSTVVERTTTKAAPTIPAGLKEDTADRQQAKKSDHVVAPAGSTAIEDKMMEIAATEAEVTSPSKRTEPDFSGEGVLDTQEQEGDENGAAEPQQSAEVEEIADIEEVKAAEGVDEEDAEREEEHVTEEDPRRPAGGIDEFKNDDTAAVDGDGDVIDLEATGNEHETNQEDIYTWIEDEEKIMFSLPITVDNVEKELTIFEGDEPIDVVLAFCRDNMPGEGACADELFTVVQDRIFPDRGQEEKLS